jgi:hypothetical protein
MIYTYTEEMFLIGAQNVLERKNDEEHGIFVMLVRKIENYVIEFNNVEIFDSYKL